MRARPIVSAALTMASIAALAAGCSSETDPTCEGGARKTWIITSLAFTREVSRGVAPGFDLDRTDNTVPDEKSCGKSDLVAPDGARGIDNQLALVVPVVEKEFGNAIDGIIQGAINDGRLLIAFDLTNVNDTTTDRCVDMEVKLGEGKPSLGTDGVLDAYQTFDLRREGQLISPARDGKIENGTFTIGPFPLRIPIAVFDVSFTIFIRDALVRFTIDEEGNAEGMLGGGISIDEVADGVKDGAGVAPRLPQIRAVGALFSDLGYDAATGKCSLVSAALTFKARPTFFR